MKEQDGFGAVLEIKCLKGHIYETRYISLSGLLYLSLCTQFQFQTQTNTKSRLADAGMVLFAAVIPTGR